jgi:hypothetical protein
MNKAELKELEQKFGLDTESANPRNGLCRPKSLE